MNTKPATALIVTSIVNGRHMANSPCHALYLLIQTLRAVAESKKHEWRLPAIIGICFSVGVHEQVVAQRLLQSTANLSQGRLQFASTSVENYALFAGGGNATGLVQYSTVDIFDANAGQ